MPLRRVWTPAILLVVLFLAGALPLILTNNNSGRGAFDAINFHELAIRTFAQEWPRPDLAHYPVASTPGYHLALAPVARYIDDSSISIRLAGLVFTIGFIVTLARAVAGMTRPWLAAAICLPIVCSSYVFQAGVWVLPDNAGWWAVLAVILIALHPRPTFRLLALGGAMLVLLVLARQIHIWAAASLWAAAWLGRAGDRDAEGPDAGSLLDITPRRLGRLALAAAVTLPAFAVVAAFMAAWGGNTPPLFRGMYDNPGWSAAALILSLLGIFSCFFAPFLYESALRTWRTQRLPLLLACAAGAIVAIIPDTTMSVPEGRFSGLWNLLPDRAVVGGHTSLAMVALSVLGAVALTCWAGALGFRDRWIMLGSFAAFAAAQTSSPMVWQRYNEPFILVMCALMAARIAGRDPEARDPEGTLGDLLSVARPAGPIVLAVLSAALTAATVLLDAPAVHWPLDPKATVAPQWMRLNRPALPVNP